MRARALATSALLLAALLASPAFAEVRVATSGTFTAAYHLLKPDIERALGEPLVTVATSIGAGEDSIPRRLERGEAIDVVIVADTVLTQLIDAGIVLPDSRVDLVRSTIGIAVRAGAPKPDIRTVAALRQTLLAAKSVAYSASVSGTYVSTELYAKLGIAREMTAKSRRIEGERVGAVVARGEAELGFQQLSELKPIAGIEVVGPLPDEVQKASVFSAGVIARSPNVAAARRLLGMLASPEAAPAIELTGLTPLHGH
ncbi:MAG TPA: substrate-binding domain-containing protein [Gammaproteobacteria bacterium]|nr:substrate-binding domain-containing protein [Gammaproteobacteria bacterium]